MPRFLNTRGKASLAIAVCDRCRTKRAYVDLTSDPNAPGLRVCPSCRDGLDPYRLPARQTERITLRNPRLDTFLGEATCFLLTEDGATILRTEIGSYLTTCHSSTPVQFTTETGDFLITETGAFIVFDNGIFASP